MSWRSNWRTTHTPTCREGKQVCAQRETHLIAEGAFMLVGQPPCSRGGRGLGDGDPEEGVFPEEFGLSGRT